MREVLEGQVDAFVENENGDLQVNEDLEEKGELIMKREDILKESEEIKFIKNDLYAYDTITKEKREINSFGCDLNVALSEEIEINKNKIRELEKQIDDLRLFNSRIYYDKGLLFKNGFCDKSQRAYKRDAITNKIISEFRTHVKNCRNKGVEE